MAEDQQKKSGQLVLANLKNQKQAMDIFKTPVVPVQKKKSKKIILSEEKYLSVSNSTSINLIQSTNDIINHCRN